MAEWSAAYINDLPDSSFAYIESGGEKDDEGKTTPRALRHFPHHDAQGNLDLPHLRNALSRGPQSDVWPNGQDHLEAHARAEEVGDRKSASELVSAVKFVGPDTIEGPAFLFDVVDLHGETFTADTDFCLDWFGRSGRPLLYEHGLDGALKTAPIGVQSEYEARAEGIWAQSQLNIAARFRKGIDQLIEQGALAYTGGAMAHLATKVGQSIKRFPWVELSLTPTPAQPANASVYYLKSADAVAHLEAAGVDVPGPLKAALVALDEWAESRDDPDALPDGASFADVVDRLTVDAAARVAARKAWYAKSGRVLSAVTRERLLRHPGQLRELADDLDELLTTADQEKATKRAGDLWQEQIQSEAAFARLLGVEVPTEVPAP